MFILSSVVFVFIILFKSQIIGIIYPKISLEKRGVIAMVLLVNMFGFILNVLNQTINRAVIALKFTNILITTSIFRFITNIVFDIIFAVYWGVIGIAVASVMMHLVGLIVNYYLFNKHNNLYLKKRNDLAVIA